MEEREEASGFPSVTIHVPTGSVHRRVLSEASEWERNKVMFI
jgi:hypothetical protein